MATVKYWNGSAWVYASVGVALSAADQTKLDGIEALADVTDATNVDAAGAVMNSDVDAKGDLFVATANNTVTRLAVGTNDQVLTADSAEASGVKWATAAGGGASQVWASPAQFSKEGASSTADPSGGGATQLHYHALPDAATTVFYASQMLPSDWATFDVDLYFYNPNASGGDVSIPCRLQQYSLGDDAATTSPGTILSPSTVTVGAQDVLTAVAAYSGISYTSGDLVVLYIRRDGTVGADTLAGEYRFCGALFTKAS